YAPVATWGSIRLLLILTLIHSWYTVQLDYVSAFPQAPVERDLYMSVPKGFEIEGAEPGDYVFKLNRNLYGQKQAGRVWNKYLVKGLTELGFKQSNIDECVFFKEDMIYVLYTDDSILAGPDKRKIEETVARMKTRFEMTEEGDLSDFLGINIERISSHEGDGFVLSQPHLIDQVIQQLKFKDNTKTKETPMRSSVILSRHPESTPFDNSFHYRSVIGKLNYLEKGSRPDISYAVHQCARFCSAPMVEHGDAVRWIVRYLKGTRDKGLHLQPQKDRSFEVFVDADFAGNWHKDIAGTDADTARSRHGYIIMYAGCPIVWKSQLQTEIALSSTESEYIGLSYALREAIPIMELLKEMRQHGFQVKDHRPKVHCRVFEDNSGALEMARVHKVRPRTKHINVKLHHFRGYVDRGEITIHPISTHDQMADILTKPLSMEPFTRFRSRILGW
ncbi:MAG: reverse transcriptase domain-containing protein, partial [Cyanobacteriota bacterium]